MDGDLIMKISMTIFVCSIIFGVVGYLLAEEFEYSSSILYRLGTFLLILTAIGTVYLVIAFISFIFWVIWSI